MTIKENLFALLLGVALLSGASGCGDTHKIPTGAPKGNSDPVNIDMGGGTEAGKDAAAPTSETPPAETPPAADTAPSSDAAAPPAEKAPAPPAEK